MEITAHIPLIIIVFILLGFSAFFSGSEVAYFSLQYSIIEKMRAGGKRRRMAASLMSNPRRLLVTILLGNLLVNIAGTSAVTALTIESFGKNGVGIATAVMTVLILVFGEITPKDIAYQHSVSLAVIFAPIYRVLIVLSAPAGWFLGLIADYSVKGSSLLLGEPNKGYDSIELVSAVEAGHRNGLFKDFEREILSNFFLFAETTVEEIQTPRGEVFSIDAHLPLNKAVPLVKKYGFSRVPLYEETTDSIVGVLFAKELLKYPSEDKIRLKKIMRPVWFVPESKKIRYLLNEFISERHHVAIVVDEHGTYSGIITLEDILEEIFGEIRDRREPKVEAYHVIEGGEIIVDGTFRIEGLNRILGTRIDSGEVETVGGYLTENTGRIPREGESFNIDNMRFLVISAGETRVDKIKVTRIDNEMEKN